MNVPEFHMEAPAAARYHRQAVEQIINSVEEGINCALLGPRLSGKTLLLHYLESYLAKLLGWKCVYIDLLTINTTTQQAFFADIIQKIRMRFSQNNDFKLNTRDNNTASSADFRAFLSDCLNASGSD
ncbi:MAG: hypothetical protein ACNA8H_15370, partial [Anaerolineales bacterium]